MSVEPAAESVVQRNASPHPNTVGGWSFRRRTTAVLVTVIALQVLGWGLALMLAGRDAAWLGIASLAWVLGLRHAFDADHIAAIDNVSRCMVGRGERPAAVGLMFALGHSTVVAAASAFIAVTALHLGAAIVGAETAKYATAVSMLVLLVVAPINLRAAWHRYAELRGRASRAAPSPHRPNGPLAALLAPLLRLRVRSRHMFVLGFAFGLGFETATSIALLGMAGAEADLQRWAAALILPLLFAAGMTLVDATEGLLMVRAYHWAADDPRRRTAYQFGIALLSGVVALLVAAAQAARLVPENASGALQRFGAALDAHFEEAGALIVLLFIALWAVAYVSNRRTDSSAAPFVSHSTGADA